MSGLRSCTSIASVPPRIVDVVTSRAAPVPRDISMRPGVLRQLRLRVTRPRRSRFTTSFALPARREVEVLATFTNPVPRRVSVDQSEAWCPKEHVRAAWRRHRRRPGRAEAQSRDGMLPRETHLQPGRRSGAERHSAWRAGAGAGEASPSTCAARQASTCPRSGNGSCAPPRAPARPGAQRVAWVSPGGHVGGGWGGGKARVGAGHHGCTRRGRGSTRAASCS